MRAQLLRSGDEPLAQLLYLGTSGAPLALYAKKGEGTAAPSFKRYGALGSVAWSQGGIAYLLAGEGDEASLMKLAEAIRVETTAPAKAAPAYSPLPTASQAQAEAPSAPCAPWACSLRPR